MSKGGERWSPVPEGRIGGGQGVNQEPKTSRPEVGIARTPPRLRSPEGQQGVRERQVQENGVDSDTYLRNVRADLIKRGGFFDEKGKMTKIGKKILRDAGWSDKQLEELDGLGGDPVGEVETIMPVQLSAREANIFQEDQEHIRRLKLAKAREDARKELEARGAQEQARLERDAKIRNIPLAAAQAGIRAYDDAINRNLSNEAALRAQRVAERDFRG